MILNQYPHDMYLPDRKRKDRSLTVAAPMDGSGTREEREAWMRAKQARKHTDAARERARRRVERRWGPQRVLAGRIRKGEGAYERRLIEQAERGQERYA